MKWTPSLQWSQPSLLLCVSYHSMVSWVPVLGMTNNLKQHTGWLEHKFFKFSHSSESYELLLSTLGHFYICYRLFFVQAHLWIPQVHIYKSYRLNTSVDQQITFRALLSLCLQCFSNTCFFISPKVQFNSKGLTVWLQCWLSSPYVIQAFVAHLLCVTTQLW